MQTGVSGLPYSASGAAEIEGVGVVVAACNGDDPAAIATGSVNDSVLGVDVPSVLATPVWITADTVQTVVDAGQANAADICKGIEDLCAKAGVA